MKNQQPQIRKRSSHQLVALKPWNEMSRKERREVQRKIQSDDLSPEVVHPDAAGIDIGNEAHYVAVSSNRSAEPVRRFGCTTAELKSMADWLKQCRIRTVAPRHLRLPLKTLIGRVAACSARHGRERCWFATNVKMKNAVLGLIRPIGKSENGFAEPAQQTSCRNSSPVSLRPFLRERFWQAQTAGLYGLRSRIFTGFRECRSGQNGLWAN